eukprot:GCRY01000967.1.p1 GENE.GCRY01000967.1~~GCRY01000967.1.p1  ORF type:complete len:187 (+),score=24.52 GCRY01000967.1:150-710(+)
MEEEFICPFADEDDIAYGSLHNDAPYVSTPLYYINEFISIAEVAQNDCILDLGCGDGRSICEAVKMTGCKGYGVDINLEALQEAEAYAKKADLTGQVSFFEDDLFEILEPEGSVHFNDGTKIKPSVIFLFLVPRMLSKPAVQQFMKGFLKRGGRVVCYFYGFVNFKATKTFECRDVTLYLYNKDSV